MAEQQVSVAYLKSPLWRIVFATGAAIGAIGGPTGQQIILRFTNEWADVEKEVFQAEVSTAGGGTYHVKSDSQIVMGPLSKIEEVAITLPPDAVANLVIAMLKQSSFFSPEAKQKVRDAATQIPQS
jgi:hypothetical protein